MALTAEERESCPGCGEPVDLATSIDSDGAYTADAIRCHGCAAQARASEAVTDKAGLLVQFTRRPTPEAD